MTIELPEKAVLLNQVHIVEYLGEDGEILRHQMCATSDESEMDVERVLLLLEWCKAKQLAPMIAEIIADDIRADACECESDEGDDDYDN